jgi:hypothetical protein
MNYLNEHKQNIILQTDYLQMAFDSENQMLLTEWSGWLNSEKGKSGCAHILDKVKELRVIKILNDNSKVTGSSGDTEWLGRVWLPSLKAAGLQYFAWVYSPEFFTQLQIDSAVDRSSGLAVKTFFSRDEARQWLNML